jgi:hypothetical protein
MSFNKSIAVNKVAVDAGATNNPVAVMLDDTLYNILVYIVNEGASTNLEVSLGSSPDGVINAPAQKATLNQTTKAAVFPFTVVPAYLIFTAKNLDASNATTYSVIISKRA